MKKVLFGTIVTIIFCVLLGAHYFLQKQSHENTENTTGAIEKADTAYREVIIPDKEGRMFGTAVAADANVVTFKEIVQLNCFQGDTYILDAEEQNAPELSTEEVDAQYNTEHLPWCPPHDELFRETGRTLTFPLSSTATFLPIDYYTSTTPVAVSKEVFLKQISEKTRDYFYITTNGTQVTKIEEIYQD